MAASRRSPGGALSLLVVVALVVGVWLINGRDPGTPSGAAADPIDEAGAVALADLPPEAADTVELIDRGGPFPYDGDGAPFGNREGLLPDRGYRYYREYTVVTPGSDDRGARRIVAGAGGELYWTDDHYASFVRIRR
jgi:ribonuclease T1